MILLVYSSDSSPRLEYTLDLVFKILLSLDYQLIHDRGQFQQATVPKINFSRSRISEAEIFIPSSQLLFESGIKNHAINVFQTDGRPAFFQARVPGADFPFDLFGMVFYLVSRYEEYTTNPKDNHQRFPASASLAFQRQFLQQPLVNQWTIALAERLKQKFPGLVVPKSPFQFCPTYDVDLAWAFLHRPWWRTLGGLIKTAVAGHLRELQQRIAVQTGKVNDPFFTFPYLRQLHQPQQIKPAFFFLLGDYGPFDKNIPYDHPALRQLIQELLPWAERIGIHPSYRSNAEPERIAVEKKRLEQILQQPVLHSRQHFLKLNLPTTYRRLLAAGIQHDHTMGYADQVGFRASIATPFRWYDLAKEQATGLWIHPFQVMDVTLKQYLKLKPEEVLPYLQPMITSCREVGGQFSTLWHNSSFSELEGWAPWKGIYEKLVAALVKT